MTGVDFSKQQQRLNRANAKGAELGTLIQDWVDKKPFGLKPKIADDRHGWTLTLRLSLVPPLDELALTFSEAIHQLRSSLDNLVMTIAEANRQLTPKEKKSLQFPIAKDSKEWGLMKSWISPLPVPIQTAVENIQPFQRYKEGGTPESDLLMTLRDLSNQDKHHIQVVPILTPAEVSNSSGVEFETEEDAKASIPPDVTIHNVTITDGALLMEQRTKGRIKTVKGVANYGFQVQVQLPNGKFAGLTQVLGALCYYTNVVFNYLTAEASPHFRKPPVRIPPAPLPRAGQKPRMK